MILFHGTNVEFNKIEINKTKKFKDFGQGFYLTDIRSQAEELEYKKLNSQYYFGTQKAINLLTKFETI